MAFENQLKEQQVILATIPAEEYQDELIKILKFVEKNNRMILYVSFNRPRQTLMDVFKQNGVNPKKFSIMEFLTPRSMTELGFRISATCQNQRFDAILIDSLRSLMVCTPNENEVLRFVHALTVRARISGCRVIFPIPYGALSPAMEDDLTMLMDSVFDLDALRKRAVLKEVIYQAKGKPQSKNKRG